MNISKLRRHGINTLSQLQILQYVGLYPGSTLSKVSSTGLEVDAVRKAVGYMEGLGLIKSKKVKGLRGRVRQCKLTAKGKRVLL